MASSPSEAAWKLSHQDALGPEDVAEITQKLDRIDARSSDGPWTRKALRLISDNPGVVSTVLAEKMKLERFFFKAQVRKLKRIGLTHSLETGYRISPRGEAYMKAVRRT